MPKLTKSVLSMYLRSGCQRQLALNLYDTRERRTYGMPHSLRDPALGLVGRAGLQWQAYRIALLIGICGDANVRHGPSSDGELYERVPLEGVMDWLREGRFVVEPTFNVTGATVSQALGIEGLRDSYGNVIDMSNLAPDLLQILPKFGDLPEDRRSVTEKVDSLCQRILVDGTVETISPTDPRMRLRVIDFKMSSDPGAHYFAKAAFYSVALAGWLAETGWDDRFVVSAAPGIWSLSDDGGELSRILESEGIGGHYDEARVAEVIESELDVAPYEVFATRLKRFFNRELTQVVGNHWEELDWHVSAACSYCEFLGHSEVRPPASVDGPGPKHCWELGIREDRLCQVAGMPRSSARVIGDTYGTVAELAMSAMNDDVFLRSHSLRAKRHLFPSRAQALKTGQAGLIEGGGSSATMPRWPDLHIYLFLEYDLSTAITAAFGIRAFWMEPFAVANEGEGRRRFEWSEFHRGDDPDFREVLLVEERTAESERVALLDFLSSLKGIMERAHGELAVSGDNPGSYQIYIWDDAQRRQLVRVLGRHLPAILEDPEVKSLAWLFPPPELLPHPEEASRSGLLPSFQTWWQGLWLHRSPTTTHCSTWRRSTGLAVPQTSIYRGTIGSH